jgi:MscS family membrane protein
LRPADTSSPRDTLRSFIENTEAAALAVQRGGDPARTRTYGSRIRQTIDSSGLINPYDQAEQSRRLIYLKEILDRIELPPEEAIPGDAEVADGAISSWTIPNTEIKIWRIEEGERAGEFLFSAETVANLDRFYRRVRDLPYKPGATAGLLEDYLALEHTENTIARRIRDELQPIDTSNPQRLLQEFLENLNAAFRLVMEADAGLRSQPPSLTLDEALEIERQANDLIDRAVRTLDLSTLPEAVRESIAIEKALQLKEILDRTGLPAIESIPDAQAVADLRGSGGPVRWRYPHTQIEIVELTEGPRAGRFRFSARTVDNLDKFYRQVKGLPYRTSDAMFYVEEYDSPETSPGFYEFYISTPGSLIPGVSRFERWIRNLPASFKKIYFEQTLWQWLGIAVGTLIAALLVLFVFFIGRLTTRHLASPWAEWIKLFMPIVNAYIVIQLVKLIDKDLNVTGWELWIILGVGTALVYLFAAGAIYRFCVAVGESIASTPRLADRDFDASLVRIAAYALGFVAAITVVVFGFQRLGADVVPLLAGLGFGGLAVALAVRPTLENMIGGLILYADRPIRVGDYCTFSGQSGTVERIGLRSTRIRAMDRTQITVPNSTFADMQLINWARCDKMLITTVIGLRYETTPEQMRHVLARMRELCFAHPKIENETHRVRFSGFGASSLDVTVRVYALTNEWNEYYAIREDLYLRFAELIEASGTSVAFPSRTLYVGRDNGLDPSKIEAAEHEVAAWRDADALPFPLTPEPLAARIADTLDYPPKGSPEAAGRLSVTETEERLSADDEDDERHQDEPAAVEGVGPSQLINLYQYYGQFQSVLALRGRIWVPKNACN